jgi:hypothetical protein
MNARSSSPTGPDVTRRLALSALAGTLVVVTGPRRSRAGDDLVVKARAQLTDLETVARGFRIDVSGVLRDNLGQPVARERVEVSLDGGSPLPATTDANGRFQARLAARAEGARAVSVRFPGSSLLGPADANGQVTVGRVTVTLTFEAPTSVPGGEPVDVAVRAVDTRGIARHGLVVRLEVDGAPLPPATTGPDGRARWTLRALPRGVHRLEATSAADEVHLAASARHDVTSWTALAIALDGLPETLGPDDVLDASGRVEGAEGVAIPIVLTIDGQPVGGTSTATTGAWRITLPAESLPAGRVEVRALAAPTDPGFRTAFSERRSVTVQAPPPPSAAWVVVPVVLGALAAGLAAVRRRGPGRVAPPAEPAVPPTPLAPFVRAAVEAGDGALVVSVRDAVTGGAIASAECRLSGDPTRAPVVSTTDGGGNARLVGVGDTLLVRAEGFAPAEHPCPVPPGGAVHVHLSTRRARIQACHEEVLRVAGRPVLRFGRDTPAQSARALRDRGAPDALVSDFTAAVERGCFGPLPPSQSALDAVESAARALRAHFADRAERRRAGAPP